MKSQILEANPNRLQKQILMMKPITKSQNDLKFHETHFPTQKPIRFSQHHTIQNPPSIRRTSAWEKQETRFKTETGGVPS